MKTFINASSENKIISTVWGGMINDNKETNNGINATRVVATISTFYILCLSFRQTVLATTVSQIIFQNLINTDRHQ